MDDNGAGDPATSGGEPTDSASRRRRTVQPVTIKRRRRRIMIGVSVTGIIVIGFGLWLGYTAREAYSNLNEARDHATAAKNALLDGHTEEALQSATDADKYATLAESATGSVPWRVAAAVPWVGAPFESIQQISSVVHGLTRDVLTPVVDAGASLVPDQLIEDGGRVNLQPLQDAAPVLAQTSEAAQQLAADAESVPEAGYVSAVDDARTQLVEMTADLSKLLTNTATAAKLAPAMLGADGPRNYFIGFQTNAEARGTGGLLGGFGVIRANDGAVEVDTLAANSELKMDMQPLDLGPEYAAMYGRSRPTTDFRNSNLSSHFPYAAQIWQSLWRQESGEQVNGAIATDPIALSYVLGAVGSVRMPDGEVITKDNVVELTESTAYIRFAEDNDARKAYLQMVAAKVVEKMTGKLSNPQALFDALGKAASEGRIAVWSADPAEQEVLAGTVLGHTLPGDEAPFAGVVINNQAGNKLDYYLAREIDYTSGSCEAETRDSTVTVRLTNNTPPGEFPNYVAGLFLNQGNLPKGTNVSGVRLVATQGATLKQITVDGKKSFINWTGSELGHPMFEVFTPVPQGQTVEVKFEYTEPTVPGEPRVPVQPLVDTPSVTVDVPVCGAPE